MNPIKGLSIFLLISGCITLVLLIASFTKSLNLYYNGKVADGVVTSMQEVTQNNHIVSRMGQSSMTISTTLYHPVVTFKALNGISQSIQYPEGYASTSEGLIGTHVLVLYDQNNPSNATFTLYVWTYPIVFGVFTIILFVISYALYRWYKKPRTPNLGMRDR